MERASKVGSLDDCLLQVQLLLLVGEQRTEDLNKKSSHQPRELFSFNVSTIPCAELKKNELSLSFNPKERAPNQAHKGVQNNFTDSRNSQHLSGQNAHPPLPSPGLCNVCMCLNGIREADAKESEGAELCY